MPGFERRDAIRTQFGADILEGVGVEIGGGAYPQALPGGTVARYYDIRTDDQAADLFDAPVVAARPVSSIPADFPGGADFLIAHNVLEHCADPIGTLLMWNSFVRVGGLVLVSLPHYRYCFDSLRRVPPLEHLVEDFLLHSDGTDFASREHTASFTLGWSEDYCASQGLKSIGDFSRRVLDGLHSEGHDVHWHALDTDLSLRIVAAAAYFDGTDIAMLRAWSPETGETIGDILVAYRITGRRGPGPEIEALIEVDARRKRALEATTASIRKRDFVGPAGRPRVGLLQKPFVSDGGHCFMARIPPEFLAHISPDMTLQAREGDQLLGPGETLHDAIRTEGAGRYSFWGEWLYLSSSDGSDCNSNGRPYFVVASP